MGVSVFIGLAALGNQANLLFLLFGLAVGALVVSQLVGTRSFKRLRISRAVPKGAVAGRPFEITYRVSNLSRFARAYSVCFREEADSAILSDVPQGYVTVIPAASTVSVQIPVLCTRRGRLCLGKIQLYSRFPFGLLTHLGWANVDQEVIIYPTLGKSEMRRGTGGGELLRAADRARRLAPSGLDEFDGIREFRHGDSPRLIYWRRTARTGQLVVRVMREYRRSRLMVVVDPRAGGADEAAIDAREEIISRAATLCCEALEHGMEVGLIALGADGTVIPPVGGREHRTRFLRELALLEEDSKTSLEDIAARLHVSSMRHSQWRFFTAVNDDSFLRVVARFDPREGRQHPGASRTVVTGGQV